MLKAFTIETTHDLSYLTMVINEALRFMPPIQSTSNMEFNADTVCGGHQFKKGDVYVINFRGLHYHADEWQRPNEFLPDRFDPDSPLYLAPSGRKRHPFCYVPFSGGKRVCFGKTSGELNMKFMATYLSQNFNFEFVDKDKYTADVWPECYIFNTRVPKRLVRVTKRFPDKKVN